MNQEQNYLLSNKVFLQGTVVKEPVYSHEMYGEGFYELYLSVKRLSDFNDVLPITVSERLMKDVDTTIGSELALNGQFRSYNKLEEGRSKLMLTVFVREFCGLTTDSNATNFIELNGYICKEPIYRTTPFNREICDILVAINRAYNKSDYIPCIAWGRNARFIKDGAVGQKITLSGRIQSREYNKKISEEQSLTKVAYEVSISKISMEI